MIFLIVLIFVFFTLMSPMYCSWFWRSFGSLVTAYSINHMIFTLTMPPPCIIAEILALVYEYSATAIDCLERLVRNDLLCVELDVKPYTLTHWIQKWRDRGWPWTVLQFKYNSRNSTLRVTFFIAVSFTDWFICDILAL